MNFVKAHYISFIQARTKGAAAEQCDAAKCIAFCTNTCESMCTDLESTDESFLSSISWTKDMCDIEKAKGAMKADCEKIRENTDSCDANCDRAPSMWALPAFWIFPILPAMKLS